MFLINSYVYTSFDGFNLNDYASDSPVLALSLRRINTAYTGPLIRLRRASDNAESDFGSGLAMGDFLDYTAIDAWSGGSITTVVTWYDQSGEGRNLVQPVASRQPRLDSGATTGRAVRFMNTTDNHLYVDMTGTDFFSTGPAFSIHHATDNQDNAFATNMSISTAPMTAGQTTYFRTNRYGTNCRVSWAGTQHFGVASATSGNEYLYYHHDGSNINIDVGTSQVFTASSTTQTASGGDVFNLGADATTHEWAGYTYELIIFDSSQATADSDDIRDEMISTYNL